MAIHFIFGVDGIHKVIRFCIVFCGLLRLDFIKSLNNGKGIVIARSRHDFVAIQNNKIIKACGIIYVILVIVRIAL